MSYYGGYARGDYYRGDPFLGAIGGALLGKAAGWAGRQLFGSGAKKAVAAGAAGMPILTAVGNPIPGLQIPGTNTTVNPGGILPGGRPFMQPTTSVASDGQCGKGYHLNKSDGKYGPKGTYCVRNRSMNPLNPRALKRGLRRAERFEKFARRTVNGLRRGPKKFKA